MLHAIWKLREVQSSLPVVLLLGLFWVPANRHRSEGSVIVVLGIVGIRRLSGCVFRSEVVVPGLPATALAP